MLNGSDGVTQRFLNGPAVDQVLAAEQVGGSYAGTNWLLADAQGTVRDVVRATVSDGSVTSVAAIDHVFYDVFGQQDAPQTAGSGQASTQVGFQGMLIDPLAGFHFVGGGSGGGGGGYAPANSATGLYYSPVEGFYDSISQTHLTGAAGDASGAVNPYEVEGDAPTATAIVMADPPENSASPVGVMQSSGEGPDFAEYGSGVPVYKFKFFDEDCYLRWSGNSDVGQYLLSIGMGEPPASNPTLPKDPQLTVQENTTKKGKTTTTSATVPISPSGDILLTGGITSGEQNGKKGPNDVFGGNLGISSTLAGGTQIGISGSVTQDGNKRSGQVNFGFSIPLGSGNSSSGK